MYPVPLSVPAYANIPKRNAQVGSAAKSAMSLSVPCWLKAASKAVTWASRSGVGSAVAGTAVAVGGARVGAGVGGTAVAGTAVGTLVGGTAVGGSAVGAGAQAASRRPAASPL